MNICEKQKTIGYKLRMKYGLDGVPVVVKYNFIVDADVPRKFFLFGTLINLMNIIKSHIETNITIFVMINDKIVASNVSLLFLYDLYKNPIDECLHITVYSENIFG